MSKRGPGVGFDGDEIRYGPSHNNAKDSPSDKPMKATAAQMAKRKIAQAHKRPMRRSESPAISNAANGATDQPAFQAFSSLNASTAGGFNFGATTQSFGQAPPQNQSSNQAVPSGSLFSMSSAQPHANSSFGGQTGTPSFGTSFNTTSGTPQLNGNGSVFGQSNNISTSFGQTQQQSQQGGPTPSSTPGTLFGSFGKPPGHASQAGNTNGLSFGQVVTEKLDPPRTNLFAGFGQNPSLSSHLPGQATNGMTKGLAQPAEDNAKKSLFPTTQGETPKVNTGTLFGPGPQPSAGATLFGAKLPPPASLPQSAKSGKSVLADLPTPSTKTANGEPLFKRATNLAVDTPKPATSNFFSRFGQQNQQGGDQLGTTGSSIFAKQTQSGQQGAEQTVQSVPPAAKSVFAGFRHHSNADNASNNPPTTPQTNLFGSFGQTPATQQKLPAFGSSQTGQNKTSSNLFNSLSNQAQTNNTIAQPVASQQDTSMTTPGNTPQKLFQSQASETPPGTSDGPPQEASETPAPTKPKSLWDRLNPVDQQKITDQRKDDTPQSLFNSVQTSAFTPSTKPLFGMSTQLSRPSTPAAVDPPAAPAAPESQTPKAPPPSSMFQQTGNPPPRPMFGLGATAASTSSTTPALSFKAPTVSPVANSAAAAPPLSRNDIDTNSGEPTAVKTQLRDLNLGLLAYLKTQSPETDWSVFWSTALALTAKITGKPLPAALGSSVDSQAMPSMQADTVVARPGHPFSTSAPPSTAANKKRPFEGEHSETGTILEPPNLSPSSPKRSKLNEATGSSKLPGNASNTSKLFESMLDKQNIAPSPDSGAGRTLSPHKSLSGIKNPASSTSLTPAVETLGPHKPPTGGKDLANVSSLTPTLGPTPSVAASQALKTSSAPSAAPSGFVPNLAAPKAGSGGFLAAFGNKAQGQTKQDRSKRKAEDYDSDEEDAAAWEARDEQEQREKRQKIEEAAKQGAGFVFKPVSSTKAPTTAPGTLNKLFDAAPTTGINKVGKQTAGLFGSVNQSTAAPLMGSSKSSSNLFSGLQAKPGELSNGAASSGAAAEKSQGAGDNTWKPNTPLKFGFGSTVASTAASGTGLFGSSFNPAGASHVGAANIPTTSKPGFGFGFGTPVTTGDASRGTKFDVRTNGEDSAATPDDGKSGDDEPSDSPKTQAASDDASALQPTEVEGNDVLFETPEGTKALCKRFELDKNEQRMTWATKGTGRFFIIKSRDTGRVRIIFKQMPLGQLHMNFEPVKGAKYAVHPQKLTAVTGPFIDHIASAGGESKLTNFWVQLKTSQLAADVAKILSENVPE